MSFELWINQPGNQANQPSGQPARKPDSKPGKPSNQATQPGGRRDARPPFLQETCEAVGSFDWLEHLEGLEMVSFRKTAGFLCQMGCETPSQQESISFYPN